MLLKTFPKAYVYLVEVSIHNYCHADSNNYYATFHGFGKKNFFKKIRYVPLPRENRLNAVAVRYTLYNICIMYHNFINCMLLACLKNMYTIAYMRVIRDVYAPIPAYIVYYYNIPSGKNEIRLTE